MALFRPLSETRFINDANLVAYYKLEDVNDSTTNAYNLTNNNSVAFNAAKFSNGADFGTTNSTKDLTVSSTLGLDYNQNRTMSCWVKMNTELSGADSYGAIFNNSNASAHRNSFYIAYYRVSNVNGLRFGRAKAAVADNPVIYTINLGTTSWYHLVLTWDGTSIKGYVNGALVGTQANSGDGTTVNYADVTRIGANIYTNGAAGGWSSCLVDDAAIFSRVLTSAEVNDLYQGTSNLATLGVGK